MYAACPCPDISAPKVYIAGLLNSAVISLIPGPGISAKKVYIAGLIWTAGARVTKMLQKEKTFTRIRYYSKCYAWFQYKSM